MSLTNSTVGTTTGPTWATNTESNWTTIDTHDHTSGKGVQITPSGLNINADLEFNANDALELRTIAFDSSASSTSTDDRYCFYSSGGDVYWRNASGTAVQITSGTSVGSGIGNIDDLVSPAQAQYNTTSKAFLWKKDKTATPVEYAKMVFSDVTLYNYTNGNDFVQLKYTGSGATGILTVPDETGTLLSSASSVTDISVTSTTASKPDVVFANNANDATGPFLNLKNLRGGSNAGVANDDCGTIQFYGNDAANNNQIYAKVLAEVSDPTSGGEEGKLSFFVAEYDGTNTAGLILTGSSTDGEVDVTIGAGTASVTTVSGTLDVGGRTIANIGDLDCDSISCSVAADGLDINFNANTGTNKISLADNLASALDITEASNSYIKFITTNSSEQIVFGKNSTFASTTIANLGTVTTADINGGTIGGFTIDGSWTAASQTCANLGTVTTADINGGTIDAVTIGASTAAAGSFTSLDVGNGNIANVGDIDCDSVSIADAAVGLDIFFGGNTTLNKISLTDNLADALNINEGGTSYMKFVTANSSEAIITGKDLETLTTTKIKQKGAFLQSSTHQSLVLGY